MVELYGRTLFATRDRRALRHAVAVRRRAADDAWRRRRARHPHAGVPHRQRAALHACWSTGRSTSRDCDFKGQAIGWHSPTGFRHPGLHEYEGEDGMPGRAPSPVCCVTCGLDHILGTERGAGRRTTTIPRKKTVTHSLHGRVSTIPARLTGYGETWDGDDCVLWARASCSSRRCSARTCISSAASRPMSAATRSASSDRVVNHGFYRTPHMFFYHVNVGHPLLDDGLALSSRRSRTWSGPRMPATAYEAQDVGYRTAGGPQHRLPGTGLGARDGSRRAGRGAGGDGQRPHRAGFRG